MLKSSAVTAGVGRESPAAFFALMASGVGWGAMWLPLKFFGELGPTGHTIGLAAYLLLAVLSVPVLCQQRLQWRGKGACRCCSACSTVAPMSPSSLP